VACSGARLAPPVQLFGIAGPERLVAAERDPVCLPDRVAVVVEGVVQRGTVVPERDRSGPPVESAGALGLLTVPVEHVEIQQLRPAIVGVQAEDEWPAASVVQVVVQSWEPLPLALPPTS